MVTIQDVSAEQLAKVFHHYREALQHDSDGHNEVGGTSAGIGLLRMNAT